MNEDIITKFIENPFENIPTLDEAIEISKKYNIALHPKYTLYWNELTSSELIVFLEFVKKEIKAKVENKKLNYIIFPNNQFKKSFEVLALEHHLKVREIEKVKAEKEIEMIVVADRNAEILFANLGVEYKNITSLDKFKEQVQKIIDYANNNLELESVEIISKNNNININDKGGSYIGARMGRPEKAKMRKMDGRPHGLFPVGDEGGKLRNLIEAHTKHGKITGDFAIFKDGPKESVYPTNEKGDKLNKIYFEKYTQKEVKETNEKAVRYKKIELKTEEYINEIRKILGSIELPSLIKGIRGTSNKNHLVEHMAKSFLRAKNNVYVNKDGTIRFDMIEMGLTHFKAKEIGTSIKKLIELGYTHDYLGNPLKNDEQLLEIFPQDVILPDCVESGDELASDYIINTGNFVDELLEKLYKLPKFYNFKNKNDTIGHLLIGLAPHTSAGIIGRIIGYSKTQGCFSHPVWHAAQRRNLDGDENGIMLLLDGLINFSREYLPDRRGTRTMDTSLVLTSHLYLDQIDDEVHGMDIVKNYPLEMYMANKKLKHPKVVKVEKVGSRIGEKDEDLRYFNYNFTHNTQNLNDTNLCSSYKSVPLMKDKMNMQLQIGKKIRAVDENQVGTLIIDKHFMKDIKGNLRKFGMQSFRCTNCNEIFRRPPLNGKCTNCKAQSINFTIHEGSVKKYLESSFKIIEDFEVDPYIIEVLELANLRIEGVFGKQREKQKNLNRFFG